VHDWNWNSILLRGHASAELCPVLAKVGGDLLAAVREAGLAALGRPAFELAREVVGLGADVGGLDLVGLWPRPLGVARCAATSFWMRAAESPETPPRGWPVADATAGGAPEAGRSCGAGDVAGVGGQVRCSVAVDAPEVRRRWDVDDVGGSALGVAILLGEGRDRVEAGCDVGAGIGVAFRFERTAGGGPGNGVGAGGGRRAAGRSPGAM
jgi:hypothetical protein